MLRAKYIYFLFFLSSFSLFAQQEGRIETDRPDQTECPFIVKKGYIQMEWGFNRQIESGEMTLTYPTSLMKIGLGKRWEARYTSVWGQEGGRSTYQSDAVGFKYAILFPEKSFARVSLIAHYRVNDQKRDESERNNERHSVGDFVFTIQHDFPKGFGLGYNVGAEVHSNGTVEAIYRFAPNMNIGKRGYAYVEVFGRMPSSSQTDQWVDGGLAYYINDDIKLDISAGKSLQIENTWYAALGLSFRFKVF
ncbi:transporter [Aquirufa nivalisilvae]|jgi:hypothetical protein|uniref:Transporter n=1 Tax=Aquirufa nivalisilvae TaxID=2516557 RepID=A0A2S2DSM9_9BACT|nr:transporter [Aquirufa nivalisilvae]AWL08299.1 hypothetical protein HME7025_00426 [Aquirufa nivalisilvae]MCZ2478769.1 transporter [Aquirufa nivalisilvae]MCZ2483505.1 transporter [Aquirufa nivalisilvae]